MAKQLTDNELLVLGLLVETPRHGYELHQLVIKRGIREWTTLGFSSLYYILEKLAAQGLIVPISQGEGKGRQVFAVTESGQKMCHDAVRDALTTVSPYNPLLLIGLANSPVLELSELTRSLQSRQLKIQSRIASVSATREKQQPLPDFVDAIFDYNLSLLEAERAWLQRMATTLGTPMDKIDFKKELKSIYNPSSKEFSVIDVPDMSFLMIDGHGDPNTSESYKEAVEALYAVAYTIKFASKKQLGKDYGVLPLEALWTADDMGAFTARDKGKWQWTMMIMQPDWITQKMVDDAIEAVRAKKNPKALVLLRFESYDEGKAVQIMHVGSYEDEAPTLNKLHNEYIPEHQLVMTGRHHEIYLGDPRKTEPSKLKTVLRQPVKTQ